MSGSCISHGSPEKWNQYIYKEIYYKELTHMIMEAGESKICSRYGLAGWRSSIGIRAEVRRQSAGVLQVIG